jgi:hypothetical protein
VYAPDYKREPGFFAIALEEVFSFRPDWHQDDRVKPLVRQYQIALDAVLQSHPQLQDCAVSCKHCGIRFLAHPRNRNRRDLRCPFGCRQHHRRQCGNRRSAVHYRAPHGRANKEERNARRYRTPPLAEPQTESVEQTAAPDQPLPDEASEMVELLLEGVVLDEAMVRNSPMLPYVRMVVNLLEGTRLRCHQIVRLLLEALRQRSIAYRRRSEYLLDFLHQHPPQHPP